MKYLRRIFTAFLFALPAALPAADTKPNVILILIDDMGYGDVGAFGSTRNHTPNIDRMAREGMKLTSFYAAPVCTPSRAQVLTGCYAKRVSLPDVIFPACPIGISAKERSVAELLKDAGYATMCIGKWHVGDQAEFLPTRHGFDHYFGLPYSNDMGGSETGPAPAGATRKGSPPLPLVRDDKVIETVPPPAQDRLTERYTDEAVKFITDHQAKPFFLYLPHTAVHVPIHPGDKFKGHSSNGSYGDWVEEVDWSVGKILDTLHQLKLADHTLVIFTSDNGPWLTQGKNGGSAGPLRGGKGGTFEGGMREPTIAWWPGQVPAASSCDAVAGNIDLLPTFAALGGAGLPEGVKLDGRDLTQVLLGKSQQSPREAHYYFNSNRLEAVRSGPWKLAIVRQSENLEAGRNTSGTPGTEFTPTLYNLDIDIGEQHDVAAEHPEVIERLQKLVAAMDADLGVRKPGPGVRPPGRVQQPSGLYLTE